MITNLPPAFRASLQATSRKPVMLCHFHFKGEVCYLSDSPVGQIDGLPVDYDPIIESWGVISDSALDNMLFSGDSLEIKTEQINLIISEDYKSKLSQAFIEGLDNEIVEVYQWFRENPNDPPQLMEVFVAQDPITYSERSMLLSVDLVSTLLVNNPYVHETPIGSDTMDIVVGKAIGVPLVDLQTTYTTTLLEDISDTYLGIVYIDNGIGLDGFYSTYQEIWIDSEVVSVTERTASSFRITVRGNRGTTASKHYSGTKIYNNYHHFDYAVCAGPVKALDNLRSANVNSDGSDEPYQNEYTALINQDPVILRFSIRPPWLKVETTAGTPNIQSEKTLSNVLGSSTEYLVADGALAPTAMANINTIANSASMVLSDTVGGGPGTVDVLYSKQAYFTPPFLADYTKLSGGATVYMAGHIRGQYYNGVYPAEEVTGAIRGKVVTDYTNDYGEITNLVLNVDFSSNCVSSESHFKVHVNAVRNTGAKVNIATFEENTLGSGINAGITSSFAGLKVTGAVNETSFAAFKDYEIEIQVEVIECNGDIYGIVNNLNDFMYVSALRWFWTVDYLIPVSAVKSPSQTLYSKFGKNLSTELGGTLVSASAMVKVITSVADESEITQEVLQKGQDPEGTRTQTVSSPSWEVGVDVVAADWSALADVSVGLRHTMTGGDEPGLQRWAKTEFVYVLWEIVYQPDDVMSPDEVKVTYASDLVCDVEALHGADITPSELIQNMLIRSPNAPYVLDDSFDTATALYKEVGYYFNGVMPGDIRLHDAIKMAMGEGLARLMFSQGGIGILNYRSHEGATAYDILPSFTRLRSIEVSNQPTSLIKNRILIRYNKDYVSNNFESEISVDDPVSIGKFEVQEERIDLVLINSDFPANMLADYKLETGSSPPSITKVDIFMQGYILQKGDPVVVTLPGISRIRGVIAAVDRTVASGKGNVINFYTIKVVRIDSLTVQLSSFEEMLISDEFERQ